MSQAMSERDIKTVSKIRSAYLKSQAKSYLIVLVLILVGYTALCLKGMYDSHTHANLLARQSGLKPLSFLATQVPLEDRATITNKADHDHVYFIDGDLQHVHYYARRLVYAFLFFFFLLYVRRNQRLVFQLSEGRETVTDRKIS